MFNSKYFSCEKYREVNVDLNIYYVFLYFLSCNTAAPTQLNSIKNSPWKEILSKSTVPASHDNREARALLDKQKRSARVSVERERQLLLDFCTKISYIFLV